jgi:hypothetical protein
MELYIQIQNGQTINHPAFGDNLRQAFGEIPENWEPFVRVEKPVAGVYEIFDSNDPSYQKVDGVWTDVWALRPMTAAEKAAKQKVVKDAWANQYQAANWSAWTFNEATCEYDPPIPRPDPVEGKIVFWCGAENNWKDAPAYPQDGKQYKFDFFAWAWVELTA